MKYIELINFYTNELTKRGWSKSIILDVIYGCNSNINSLYELTNYLNKEIDLNLLNKIKNIMHKFLIDNIPIERQLEKKEFYGQTYIIKNNVLIPRNETELLVHNVLKILKKKFQTYVNSNNKIFKLLDLCCGSGVIGLSIKNQYPNNIDLTLSDISNDALQNSIDNLNFLNLNAQIIKSNLFNNIHHKFDIVVCNPPYIKKGFDLDASVKQNDPQLALYGGKDGLFFYRKIISQIKNYLNDRYLIVFEIGYDQANAVTSLICEYLNVYPQILKDQNGLDRIVIVNRL